MKRKLRIFLIIFVAFSFSSYAQEGKNNYENLETSEFYIKMESDPSAVVLDVRITSEYKDERIPGALLAEKKEKLIALTDTIARETPMLVYCDDGERSRTVCKILTKEQDFQEVYNLKNGLIDWKKQGLPLDKEELENGEIERQFQE
ncbi:MAG: rhodanese-like domain-containing protein [Bacteroidota bacterium]